MAITEDDIAVNASPSLKLVSPTAIVDAVNAATDGVDALTPLVAALQADALSLQGQVDAITPKLPQKLSTITYSLAQLQALGGGVKSFVKNNGILANARILGVVISQTTPFSFSGIGADDLSLIVGDAGNDDSICEATDCLATTPLLSKGVAGVKNFPACPLIGAIAKITSTKDLNTAIAGTTLTIDVWGFVSA